VWSRGSESGAKTLAGLGTGVAAFEWTPTKAAPVQSAAIATILLNVN
jgi:hypothetical protein